MNSPEADPLEVLRASALFQEYFAAVDLAAVKAARAQGHTFEQIGQAVGRTRQAIWQRFGAQRAKIDPAEARRWVDEGTTAFPPIPPPTFRRP